MAARHLIGRRVKITPWEDLRNYMPGGDTGLITDACINGNETELTVEIPGFLRSFVFWLSEVELLPVQGEESGFFSHLHPAGLGGGFAVESGV